MMLKAHAFSLIELLISLVIVTLLASVAYPSFKDVIIKSRRSNAQSELIKAQIAQSNYRILHPSYTDDANVIGLPSNDPYYIFNLVSASANNYLIKATAKAESLQYKDKSICRVLFIDQNNNKTSDGITDNTICWGN